MSIQPISPDQLKLDLKNPRFGLTEADTEEDALRILYERADLKELWNSIAERGFEPYEPLVGFPDPNSDDFIIVEGNRRLAAVRFLLNPELFKLYSVISPPTIDPEKLRTLKLLPVYIVEKREDANDYVGFKHINGPATWGSLAKARFGTMLYDQFEPAPGQSDQRMDLLSKRLGDSHQMLLRTLVAYKVFEQAKSFSIIDEIKTNENTIQFSHLYTILQSPAVREYIGLGPEPLNQSYIRDNPIPESYHSKLAYLMSWLFGTRDEHPLIQRQGTDRPKLIKIISNDYAVATLEETRDFNQAAEEAGFEADQWLSQAISIENKAKRLKDQASDLPDEMNKDDLKKAIERIQKTIKHLQIAERTLNEFYPNS